MPRETSSAYAEEGTVAHSVASWVLEDATRNAVDYPANKLHGINIDKDMRDYVQVYVDSVRELTAGGELFVEKEVDISSYVNIPNSKGTADTISLSFDIMNGHELQVHDLKYGMGVQVDADNNPQLMIYALGALSLPELVDNGIEPTSIRMFIHQPRLKHISEWSCSLEDLYDFGAEVITASKKALEYADTGKGDNVFCPGEKQCRFCKGKGSCKALAQNVLTTVLDSFDNIDEPVTVKDNLKPLEAMTNDKLSELLCQLPLIKEWCDSLYNQVNVLLQNGQEVKGFKLVEGKQGARSWTSEDEVEALLKAARIREKEMYSFKLQSPTQLEKIISKERPKIWKKLSDFITRSNGKPTVVPESDKRPPLKINVADSFGDVTDNDINDIL